MIHTYSSAVEAHEPAILVYFRSFRAVRVPRKCERHLRNDTLRCPLASNMYVHTQKVMRRLYILPCSISLSFFFLV